MNLVENNKDALFGRFHRKRPVAAIKLINVKAQ